MFPVPHMKVTTWVDCLVPDAIISCYRYWQSAVAASPSKAAKGYLLGSLLYAAIMFSLPMCIGLAVWALDLPVSHILCYHNHYERMLAGQ